MHFGIFVIMDGHRADCWLAKQKIESPMSQTSCLVTIKQAKRYTNYYEDNSTAAPCVTKNESLFSKEGPNFAAGSQQTMLLFARLEQADVHKQSTETRRRT
jgi:hypothetical protein